MTIIPKMDSNFKSVFIHLRYYGLPNFPNVFSGLCVRRYGEMEQIFEKLNNALKERILKPDFHNFSQGQSLLKTVISFEIFVD